MSNKVEKPKCVKCGTPVGCNCELTNGKCRNCIEAEKKSKQGKL